MTSYKPIVNFSSFQGFLDCKNTILNNPLDKFVATKSFGTLNTIDTRFSKVLLNFYLWIFKQWMLLASVNHNSFVLAVAAADS